MKVTIIARTSNFEVCDYLDDMCRDSWGGFGACVLSTGHQDAHRDAHGYGWVCEQEVETEEFLPRIVVTDIIDQILLDAALSQYAEKIGHLFPNADEYPYMHGQKQRAEALLKALRATY
jgi:hypothetical protein